MKKIYTVSWTETQTVAVTVNIEAESKEEAISIAKSGEFNDKPSVILQDTLDSDGFIAEEG